MSPRLSWLDGRATEERPPWGYQCLLGQRMANATVALDIQTGGGEVLAGAAQLAPMTVATESWPPNIKRARQNLEPHGVTVVADQGEPPFPFRNNAFDLVVSRHPVRTWWQEIARVLSPGGTYLSQEIGPASVFELVEFFRGPLPRGDRDPTKSRALAEAAGLEVVDLRTARLRIEFYDIGAVVYFLRKVIWMIPGFTAAEHLAKLRALHEKITEEGPFVAHSSRVLIEARKP